MQQRECDTFDRRTAMCEDDITLLAKLYETLRLPLEFLYFLMERGREDSFVTILIKTSPKEDLKTLLANNKRTTDLLFEIDKAQGVYVVVCQGTKIDGGYRFAERLLKSVMKSLSRDTYFVELEVKTTKYDIKTLIFILLEMYLKARKEEKRCEISYKSLY